MIGSMHPIIGPIRYFCIQSRMQRIVTTGSPLGICNRSGVISKLLILALRVVADYAECESTASFKNQEKPRCSIGAFYRHWLVDGDYQRRPPPPPPPPYPPPPPPPPRRSSRGRASLAFTSRPSSIVPLMAAMAVLASPLSGISTKPKPRERPDSRSVITRAESTAP